MRQEFFDIAESEVKAVRKRLDKRLLERIIDIPVLLQEKPSRALQDEGIEADVLGLFLGPALAEEGNPMDVQPSRIILFLENILEEAGGDEIEFRKQVRITYLHEMGHLLGLDEDGLSERGLD